MIKANKIYSVKDIFLTLQGEGYNSGTPAVFCRFSGCNLWNGIERDRKKAICSFCDTDFNGVNGINGGKYKLDDLVKIMNSLWPKRKKNKFVVFTGGEPILQLDSNLIKKIKRFGFSYFSKAVKAPNETAADVFLPNGSNRIFQGDIFISRICSATINL